MKKSFSSFLVFLLLISNLGNVAYATDSTPKLDIEIPKTNADIVFTVGTTNTDLSNLKKDIDRYMKPILSNVYNIDSNIMAVESSTISTNDAGASTIFNSWDKYPKHSDSRYNAGWQLSGDRIFTTANVSWTGFWDKANVGAGDVELEFDTMAYEHPDPWGFTFRMQNTASDQYKFYALEFGPSKQELVLARIDHWEPSSVGEVHGGPLYHGNVNAGDSCYGSNCGGGRKGEVYGNKVLGDVLVYTPQSVSFNKWYKVKVHAKGKNIKVWVDGALKIDYTDNSPKAILTGGYGPYTASQYAASYRNVSITTGTQKDFREVLREPEWRQSSEKFILNIDDNLNQSLGNDAQKGTIASALISENINFSSAGNLSMQSVFDSFTRNNSIKGKFIRNDNQDFSKVLEQYAHYVGQTMLEGSELASSYVLVDTPLKYSYSNLSESIKTEYGGNPWKLVHNPNALENNSGISHLNERRLASMPDKFDKVGKYSIYYGELATIPKEVIVHRAPVVVLSPSVTKVGSNYNVSLTSDSYDLDSISQGNRGIMSEEWRYKEVSGTSWTNGKLNGSISSGKNYLVQLRVKDYQNHWSDYETQLISTDGTALAPISKFDVSETRFWEGLDVTFTNTSYHPNGLVLNNSMWEIRNVDNAVLKSFSNNNNSFNYNFKSNGLGLTSGDSKDYKIALKVMDTNGKWSDYYVRNVTIEKDKNPPVISFDKGSSEWDKENVDVNLSFSKDFGFPYSRNKVIVNDSNRLLINWNSVAYDSGKTRKVSLTTHGEHYIHVMAEDTSGNSNYIVLGPYRIDKTAPNKPVITLSENDWTAYGVTFTVADKGDLGSGVGKVEYQVANGSWNLYNGVVTIPDGFKGLINVNARVTDYVGNVSVITTAVAKIDDIPPTINSVKVVNSAVDSKLVVDALDRESGLNDKAYRYYQKIVGTDTDYKIIKGGWVSSSEITLPKSPDNTKIIYKVDVRDVNDNMSTSEEVPYVSAPNVLFSGVKEGDFDNTITVDFNNPIGKDVKVKVYREGAFVALIESGNTFRDEGLDYERDYNYSFVAYTDFEGLEVESVETKVKVTIGKPTLEISIDSKQYYKTIFTDEFNVTGDVVYRKGGTVTLGLFKGVTEVGNSKVNVQPYAKVKWVLKGSQVGSSNVDYKIKSDLQGHENSGLYYKEFNVKVGEKLPSIKKIGDKDKYYK